MNKLFQSNKITLHEIYTRTELWKDKIYHISNNPYRFPKNNGSGDFLPLPQRFASILQEFKEEVNKQKSKERTEIELNESQQRINEVYQKIKELIQNQITNLENSIENEDAEDKLYKSREQGKSIFLKNLKLGLNKKTFSQFQKFNQEHLGNNEKIERLLKEWKEQREILLDRKNACFILEDNDQYLKFCYQPLQGIFVNLKEFLFYRNNIWYEVQSWERINHENAVIICQRSFFIHNYFKFFSQGANGVLHCSPNFKNQDEICPMSSFFRKYWICWVYFGLTARI